jgi:hypothetical protein
MLETDDLRFGRAEGAPDTRRAPKLKVLRKDIRKVIVDGDHLEVRHKGGVARFALGAKQAAAWAKRILEPPGLLDKLGVKDGSTVVVVAPKGAPMHESRSTTISCIRWSCAAPPYGAEVLRRRAPSADRDRRLTSCSTAPRRSPT